MPDYKAILSGQSWNALPTLGSMRKPVFLTYTFNPPALDSLWDWSRFGSADREVARKALQMWGEASGIRFIEVKGRRAGAETVTITRNEILTALNAQEQFILALVEIDERRAPRYVRQPFTREPDLNVTSVNYNILHLLALAD